MDDESPKHSAPEEASGTVTRREFLEQSSRYGLMIGAGIVGANGVTSDLANGRAGPLPDGRIDALGARDPALAAQGAQRAQSLTLSNAAIRAEWSVDANRLRVVSMREPNGAILELHADAFTL